MLIFLAESDQDLRVGLQMLLLHEPGLHVVGMAVQVESLLVQVEVSKAEVLLLDWYLPGGSVTDLLADLRRLVSPPKIIVLAVQPEVEAPALSAGADAFIGKNAPPDELLAVIRSLKKNSTA